MKLVYEGEYDVTEIDVAPAHDPLEDPLLRDVEHDDDSCGRLGLQLQFDYIGSIAELAQLAHELMRWATHDSLSSRTVASICRDAGTLTEAKS